MSDDATPDLPGHVAESVRTIARLREEHLSATNLPQKMVEATVNAVGRARSIAILMVVVLLWIGGNLGALALGHRPLDPPPFYWLQGCVSLIALFTTILILTTQRHEDELALRREHLTLQVSLLSEQKSAKIIELLEEIRRDSPHLVDRVDEQAAEMARPADPRSVVDAIDLE